MATTPCEHADDRIAAETVPSCQVQPSYWSRRPLLKEATGRLLLACGLVLPGQLEDAEAREGALGGKLGGRRSQNRRGRHRKRTHGKKKDKPRGGGPFKVRPFVFLLNLYSEHAPIKVDFYSTRLRPGQGDLWQLKESKSLVRSAGISFATAEIKAAVWLDDRILIDASGRFPGVRIGHGGDFWAGNRGWQGGTVVFDEGLEIQDLTLAFTMEGYRIRVERLSDEGDQIRYHILVNPAY